MNLKTIFEIIEGREWDWFGYEDDEYTRLKPFNDSLSIEFDLLSPINDLDKDEIWKRTGYKDYESFTLADLLANKSWCEVVWESHKISRPCPDNKEGCAVFHYEEEPATKIWNRAFEILRDQGSQKANDYIYLTMKK